MDGSDEDNYKNIYKLTDYPCAVFKVCYNKVYEYAAYYLRGHPDDYVLGRDDELKDYEDIIDTCKYKDEKSHSKRIFDKAGFFKKYKIFFNKPTRIIDNIYLGSAFNAASYRTLKKLNIKVILNVSYELSKYHKKYDDFKYHQYTVHDDNRYSILAGSRYV